MVVGERHAGKSMVASKIMASAQRLYQGQTPYLLDVEGTFDPVFAKKLGVDTDSLHMSLCESGEMAVDIADAVLGSRETSLIVVDSLAAMAPTKELETSADDQHIGLQSRLISGMVRKITAGLVKERGRGHEVTVLFLNQFRAKIGGFGHDTRSIPGGKALEFSTSLQWIQKNKENKGKDGLGVDTMSYNEHPFTITKNKINSGPRTGEFRLVRSYEESTGLSEGDIDNVPTMITYAKKFGAYTGGGTSWVLDFGDSRYRYGKAAEAIDALRDDPAYAWALRNYLIQAQAANLGMPDEFIKRIGETPICNL
jgi:recombination protein RecA